MEKNRFGYSSKLEMSKEVPQPHFLRPQLFAGMGRRGDLYELKHLPREILKKIKTAKYIGCGHSSDVWDLNDGTVLKITKEKAVIEMCDRLHKQPVKGLPQIHNVLKQNISHLGFQDDNWRGTPIKEKYVAIIQEKYDLFPSDNWHLIEEPLKHLDLGNEPNRWCRGSDNHAARGQEGIDLAYNLSVISRKIKKDDPNHPLAHCMLAMSTIYSWMNKGILGPNAGLDIDHRDNWAVDKNGQTIMLDPIFTVKPKKRLTPEFPSVETNFSI